MRDTALNDLEKQGLKRNGKLIREVRFERSADSAIDAVARFREEFQNSFKDTAGAEAIFNRINFYLNGLKDLNPWPKK